MTDAELAALSQRGDLEAFNQLARRWDGRLYRFVRRMLDDDDEARDTCQEALLKAYQNIRRLRDPSRFTAWLHHIALNLCRDRHRASARRRPQSYQEGQPGETRYLEASGRASQASREADRAALSRVLDEVLGRISPEQKTAILLREYQGFSTEEIAQITGVPTATVRTRIFYGLRSMRKILKEYGATAPDTLIGDEEP